MTIFETTRLSPAPVATAPDGTDVRLLSVLPSASLAHFTLQPGQTSVAVAHRTVEEIWYFLSGCGEVWRRRDGREEVVPVEPGVSLTIPLGAAFQFRSSGTEPLAFVAVTMPPWPGADEAFPVQGEWPPTVAAGQGAAGD